MVTVVGDMTLPWETAMTQACFSGVSSIHKKHSEERKMDFNEYQSFARTTAIYPRVGQGNVVYPVLGLCGEAGELANKVKKVERDDHSIITDSRKKELVEELGSGY